MNQYGEAIVQILQHIYVVDAIRAQTKPELFTEVVDFVVSQQICTEAKKLKKELIAREKLGSLLLAEHKLALIHCRSEAVSNLCVCVVSLDNEVVWDKKTKAMITTVLVLLAPKQAAREAVDLIGEISAALINEQFVDCLTGADYTEIEGQIRAVLDRGYADKIQQLMRGQI